jgi:hypothetical protein
MSGEQKQDTTIIPIHVPDEQFFHQVIENIEYEDASEFGDAMLMDISHDMTGPTLDEMDTVELEIQDGIVEAFEDCIEERGEHGLAKIMMEFMVRYTMSDGLEKA